MRHAALLLALLAGCDNSPQPLSQPDLASPGMSTTPGKVGTVTLDSSATSFVGAQFSENVGATASVASDTTVGPCTVHTVTMQGSPGIPSSRSAGAITITGAKQAITLTPDTQAAYKAFGSAMALWSGGETIHVKAAGAAVPAFTASATAPAGVTITAPTLPAPGTKVFVDRGLDFPVNWTGGGSGEVHLSLSAIVSSSTVYSVAVECGFPQSGGTGAVPSAALQAFPAGAVGELTLIAGTRSAFAAGDWMISLVVSSPARYASTGQPQLNVAFQAN